MITTGSQIRAGRALLGWTQNDLAIAAKLHKNAVAFWERKDRIPAEICREPHACERIRKALERAGVETVSRPTPGVRLCRDHNFFTLRARARAHHGLLRSPIDTVQRSDNTHSEPPETLAQSQLCAAQTRAGPPCRRPAMVNGRCRNHGGLSTGPRTEAGRRRIALAQKARWAWQRSHPENAET